MVVKKYLRKKKSNVRRTKRRVNRRYRRRKIIPRSNYPLAMSHISRLKYVDTITLDPSALSNSSYVFSANGMYDPNITGTGHQPYGFDQLMAMYNHYHVIGSKITVRLANSATASTGPPYYIGILLRDTATTNSTTYGTNLLLEQPNNTFRLASYGASAGNIISLRKTFSTKRFFKTKSLLENSLFRGDIASNPTEGAFFHIILTPFNDSTDNVGIQTMTVTIEFLAVFTEPKMLGSS